MTIKQLDYPALAAVQEYRIEADKMARFNSELRKTEKLDIELNGAWHAQLERKPHQTDAERIEQAESLLSGKPVLDLVEQIKRNMALADSLRRALKAQEIVLRNITQALSRKAAERFATEHNTRTRRVVAALVELAAANNSEIALREGIEALGYGVALPCMRFEPPNCAMNLTDRDGGYTPGWYQEACEYVTTPDERAAREHKAATEGRRRKLAELA